MAWDGDKRICFSFILKHQKPAIMGLFQNFDCPSEICEFFLAARIQIDLDLRIDRVGGDFCQITVGVFRPKVASVKIHTEPG